MSEIASRPGRAATAVVHESYSFACMRCGHGWEQSYEIEHHMDADGREFVQYVAGGRVVPSPLSRPTCQNCDNHVVRIMRPGRVESARNAAHRQHHKPTAVPAQADADAEAPAGAEGPRRSTTPGTCPTSCTRSSARRAEPSARRDGPWRGRAPFVGSGHAFERLLRYVRQARQEHGAAAPGTPPGAGRRLPHPPRHAVGDRGGGTRESRLGRGDHGRPGRLRPRGLAVGRRDGRAVRGRPRDRRPAPQRGPADRPRRPRRLVPAGRAQPGRGRRRSTRRSPRSTGWPPCPRSRASARRASTTSAPGPRARRRRSGPSAPTSRSPSGTARPWSSTTARPTPTSCGC